MPRSLLIVCFCLAIAGCTPAATTLPISGKVTLDGAPLESADLLFVPADPSFGSEPGKVTNGTYTAKVRPGKSKVQVTASRVVPGKFGPMGTEPLLEPIHVSNAANLEVDVTKEKKDGYDFELKSK
ncbi:hypothetical protein NA78x_003762 [Anatilimnocola sp. NA78]|uniref:hypothetical protein n=1 Tax=Anatilimnocola sp. NA78 TaxID=3415683 RepID=UPI003CE503B8